METTLQPTSINQVLSRALDGENSHVCMEKALENLRLNVTGRKILNAPYTIWQLMKHVNYWQRKFINRLVGNEDVLLVCNWQEGWEDELNAANQLEVDQEVTLLLESIEKAKVLLERQNDTTVIDDSYGCKHDVVQAMASHLSYHLGEIILLRRIFGSWQQPSNSGFYGIAK